MRPVVKRRTSILLAVTAFVVLTWVFPLFRVVSLEQVAQAKLAEEFNVESFTAEFWTRQLVPTFEQATDASELLAGIKEDPQEARQNFGRSVGIGRVYFYFFRGEGTILAIEKTGISVSCVAPDNQADFLLKTGLLFGNTIRDATGQLLAGDFANSQDFNAISKELNAIVEKQVQPDLKAQAKIGEKIRFVGCSEIRESSSDKKIIPLTTIPLQVEFPNE